MNKVNIEWIKRLNQGRKERKIQKEWFGKKK
jgi:hypothetical protein